MYIKHWENWVLYCSVILSHNAHAVYCSKYSTAKLMIVPILLHYFWLCLAHDCNVNAHAKNIPTLLMSVLCPILCKRKLQTQRLTVKFLLHPKLGGTSGVSVCTLVLCLYSCLVVSKGPDQCTQAAQYRPRPTNQWPGSESSDQSEAEKIRHPESGTNQSIIYW